MLISSCSTIQILFFHRDEQKRKREKELLSDDEFEKEINDFMF